VTALLQLAPLQGLTNRVFREAYFRHFGGFDGALAPFVLALRGSEAKPRHYKDLLPGPAAEAREGPSTGLGGRVPLVPQILGNEPVAFAETARVLADLGYAEINWNLGCPHRIVAGKQRGSGLLPFPGRIAEVLDAACAIPGVRLSVKLRLGREDPAEILRLMPILNDHPLAKVIIHPRLGIQMYRGSVDLEGFARAAALCRHRLVYNGDIVDRAGFEALRARFPGIGEWMIGRGALANPFLAEEIKAGTVAGDRDERIRSWHNDIYRRYREVLYGPAHVLDKMKEIWGYLRACYPEQAARISGLARVRTLLDYEIAVAAILRG
jgi:tRNA-dihydrouridine synthase